MDMMYMNGEERDRILAYETRTRLVRYSDGDIYQVFDLLLIKRRTKGMKLFWLFQLSDGESVEQHKYLRHPIESSSITQRQKYVKYHERSENFIKHIEYLNKILDDNWINVS